ncbi:hypothetical protein R1sor_023094 [Riccia sorocarpa]|uniref:Uncharacterized protein n=1 Tax=Riccia sorocarpa TaxID=122646 RepID=A0ABD3GMH4_9MARC
MLLKQLNCAGPALFVAYSRRAWKDRCGTVFEDLRTVTPVKLVLQNAEDDLRGLSKRFTGQREGGPDEEEDLSTTDEPRGEEAFTWRRMDRRGAYEGRGTREREDQELQIKPAAHEEDGRYSQTIIGEVEHQGWDRTAGLALLGLVEFSDVTREPVTREGQVS